MRSITDPNELAPLTQLGNQIIQERTRKVAEFATSLKWGASAIVLELSEARGFFARVGLELRTPLGEPFQDVIVGWGANREEAVKAAVGEWLESALPAALAIHSDKDPKARLGEMQVGGVLYAWRLAAGGLKVTGPDADDVARELSKNDLFSRLNLAAALPLQRDVPWFCMKLSFTRPASGPAGWAAWINNADWREGRELLQRFAVSGNKPLELRQYLMARRTGKKAATPTTSRPEPSHAHAREPLPRKIWWKIW